MSRERLTLLLHELRSPVAALVAIAETLAENRGSLAEEDARPLLALAVAAGRDLERIVVDAAPASLRRERVEPAQVVRQAVTAAGLRGAPVRAEVEPGLADLDADPARLRQALANLIANAIAHSPPGVEVVVSARERRGGLVLSVSDSGEGIPAERQAAVFEPGVRFADRPGEGLGLSVARAVAEAHGGSIEVDSAPGRGATFRLVLPRASAAG